MPCIALLELNKLRLWNDCLQGRELERKLWLLQVLLTEISNHLFGHRSPPPVLHFRLILFVFQFLLFHLQSASSLSQLFFFSAEESDPVLAELRQEKRVGDGVFTGTEATA